MWSEVASWLAFICIVAELIALDQGKLLLTWTLCLIACFLLVVVAIADDRIAFLLQQFVIGAISVRAIRKLRK